MSNHSLWPWHKTADNRSTSAKQKASHCKHYALRSKSSTAWTPTRSEAKTKIPNPPLHVHKQEEDKNGQSVKPRNNDKAALNGSAATNVPATRTCVGFSSPPTAMWHRKVTTAAITGTRGVKERFVLWVQAVMARCLCSSSRSLRILAQKESSQAYILISRMLLMISLIKWMRASVFCTLRRRNFARVFDRMA